MGFGISSFRKSPHYAEILFAICFVVLWFESPCPPSVFQKLFAGHFGGMFIAMFFRSFVALRCPTLQALRTLAVSRIYLDNFDRIIAYGVGLGMKLAQVAMSYGADDLPGRSSGSTSSRWPARPRRHCRRKWIW